MKRERFRLERVCSSDNYVQSKITHIKFLETTHNNNIVEIKEITKSVKLAYIKCFGRIKRITLEEAKEIKKYYPVIYE